MTFEQWKAKREWWKSDGWWPFKKLWDELSSAGHHGNDIAAMLDAAGSAAAEEFGGDW